MTTAADVQTLYLAYFNRPADPAGLAYWVDQIDNKGQSLKSAAQNFSLQTEYTGSNASLDLVAKVNAVYLNVFGRAADIDGLKYWVGQVNGGEVTFGEMALAVIGGATGADLIAVTAKAEAAEAFTAAVDTTPEWLAYSGTHTAANASAKAWLSLVKDDATLTAALASVDATIAAIVTGGSTGPVAGGSTQALTTGQDTLTGTSSADLFNSRVVQNQNGEEVNTLGSGDTLVGGAGVDTLSAYITSGAKVNSSGTMPIQPATTGIEMIKLQAVNSFITDGPNTEVYVNAKEMVDVTKIASNHSDANLTIQNMTTLNGLGNIRNTNTMTVGMEYTGNSDHNWSESDLHVYFDQDYLNPAATFTNPSISFDLMNEDGYDATAGARPLDGVTIGLMQFTLNGQTFPLTPSMLGEAGDVLGTVIKTYADLLTHVAAAIQILKDANAGNAALQTVTVSLGANFVSDEGRVGQSLVLEVAGDTNGTVNIIEAEKTDLQLLRAIDSAALANNNRYENAGATPTTPGTELAINVALEKVGLAGDGGALVIGSMFKDGENHFSNLYNGKGIETFNTTVYGGVDKPSSLSQLASTGNNLETVNVVTDAAQLATFASLTIGNSNTSSLNLDYESDETHRPDSDNLNALKDVRTFDAAGFKGDLTLFAGLSAEITAKYLNVKDIQADPAGDNLDFAYTSGSGHDYINLYLDPANLAKPGTGSREDFTLTVTTNTGNDEVVTSIGDGGSGSSWYHNQHINADLVMGGSVADGQLQINTGEGDDTVRTMGSGDFAVNLGTGLDTAYLDNTGISASGVVTSFNGRREGWVFNATNDNVFDLTSENEVAAQSGVANLDLYVDFKGYTAKAHIAAAGSTTGTSVTDLTINQAIKDAINNDPVLNKLLVAEDGPGRTLVVRSLIDGNDDLSDFDDVIVSLVNNSAITTGQTAASLTLLSTNQAAALGFGAASSGVYAANGTRFTADIVDDGSNAYSGGNSTATADNLVVGGTGNDVLVLGTGANSNDTVGYAGIGNGTDSIVHFDSSWNDVGALVWNSTDYEEVTLTFSASDGTPVAETIIFDGVTVNLSAPSLQGVIPALDVAAQFVSQYSSANWTAVHTGGGVVTLTHVVPGAVTDLVVGDFTGTYFGIPNGNGTVGVAITNDAADNAVGGSNSTFTVTFNAATTAAVATGTFGSFAGVSAPITLGDGSLTLANSLVTAYIGNATWAVTAVHNATTDVVTFTALAAGATVLGTDVLFKVDAATLADGIVGGVAGTVGTAASTTPPTSTQAPAGPNLGYDMLDFSSYPAAAVYVGSAQSAGNLVAGSAPTTGAFYVLMTESSTNDGEYTMKQYKEGGSAADTLIGTIGIADFGETQTFHSINFVLA